ncbi:MAG: hypothetical protein BWX87_00647 [Bacteroidetes bacterium ADurb.Bin123]|jgi:hypothetical protein|nr:MAG: hypothetical protein BWX87_00647 [Bacteroidetes bacterium ADurb.Bin123]
MIKIVTFTPVWQRPEIFEICLAGLDRLKNYKPERFEIRPFFIVSENRAAKQVERYGFDYILWQNQPLGQKKNAGLKYVMENYDFDYMMELGSDDIITNEYLDFVESRMKKGSMQFVVDCVYFVDVLTGKTACWTTDKIIGLGRCLHRDALELFAPDYELWEPQRNMAMDGCSWMNLMAKNVFCELLSSRRYFTLDIKSDVNINHLDSFVPHYTATDELLCHFPEGDLIVGLIEKYKKEGIPEKILEAHSERSRLIDEEKKLLQLLINEN